MTWKNEGMERHRDQGFSLVELVIVVAIIAILVGILAPQYIKYVERSRKAADMQNLEHMVDSLKIQAIEDPRGRWGKVLFPTNTTFAFVMWTDGNTKFKFFNGKKENYVESGGGFSEVASDNDEETIYTEIFGKNWRKTGLKSKKWVTTNQGFGTRKYIWATCYIAPDGSVSVTYCDAVNKYLGDNAGD